MCPETDHVRISAHVKMNRLLLALALTIAGSYHSSGLVYPDRRDMYAAVSSYIAVGGFSSFSMLAFSKISILIKFN